MSATEAVAPTGIQTNKSIQEQTGLSDDMVQDFRHAKMLSTGTIIPAAYQGNPANCFIAIQTAKNLRIEPFFVMNGTFVFEGKLCWYSKHLQILFKKRMGTGIEFEFEGAEPNLRCRASATVDDVRTSGPWISQQMARDSNWKSLLWRTAPELMLGYRAAAWMINSKFPEVLGGIALDHDLEDASPSNSLTVSATSRAADLPPSPGVQEPLDLSAKLRARAALQAGLANQPVDGAN